jgi:hypothetical protein
VGFVASYCDLLSAKSLGAIGSAQELHSFGEPFSATIFGQRKGIEEGCWNVMWPEEATIESVYHESSDEICYSNPENIAVMVVNNGAQRPSDNR